MPLPLPTLLLQHNHMCIQLYPSQPACLRAATLLVSHLTHLLEFDIIMCLKRHSQAHLLKEASSLISNCHNLSGFEQQF